VPLHGEVGGAQVKHLGVRPFVFRSACIYRVERGESVTGCYFAGREERQMRVTSIHRDLYLGDYNSQRDKDVHDEVEFLVGAATTLLAPPLLYGVASGEFLPLCLMASDVVLSALLGFALFKKSAEAPLSCVPTTSAPHVPQGKRAAQLKLAA
jgi:hypothetical protein